MKHKKQIGQLLLFIVGLAVLLATFSFLFVPKNNKTESGMEEASANGILGEKRNTIDMVVLGDSEAYSSIIPLKLWKDKGYTSYVCASSGQTLDYSYELLKRAFIKQTPKLVILETDALYRVFSTEKAVYSKICEAVPVFRYHNRWKNLKNVNFGKINYTWINENKGYRYNKSVNAAVLTDYMKPVETAADIPELNKKYVKAIKRFCEENGTEFLLVSTPSIICWNYSKHLGAEKLAQELKCEFLDMNLLSKEVPVNWETDTRDKGDHLNYFGAKKATAYLAEYLSKKNILPDHRQQKGYKSWNKALKKFEKIVPKPLRP